METKAPRRNLGTALVTATNNFTPPKPEPVAETPVDVSAELAVLAGKQDPMSFQMGAGGYGEQPEAQPQAAPAASPATDEMERQALADIATGAAVQGEQPAPTAPPETSDKPSVSREKRTDSPATMPTAFSDLVGKGEAAGNYDAMNQGHNRPFSINAEDTTKLIGKPLTEMTIAEVMEKQAMDKNDPGRLFAAGKYQIIPDTMKLVMDEYSKRYAGVPDPSEKFTPEVQDRMLFLLMMHKRPDVGNFLRGASDDMGKAIDEMAKEFASFPQQDGTGYHKDQTPSHTVEEVKKMLLAARDELGGVMLPAEVRVGAGVRVGPQGQPQREYQPMTPAELVRAGMSKNRRPLRRGKIPSGFSQTVGDDKLKNILFQSYLAPAKDFYEDPGPPDSTVQTIRAEGDFGVKVDEGAPAGPTDEEKEALENAADGNTLEAALAAGGGEKNSAFYDFLVHDRTVVHTLLTGKRLKMSEQRIADLARDRAAGPDFKPGRVLETLDDLSPKGKALTRVIEQTKQGMPSVGTGGNRVFYSTAEGAEAKAQAISRTIKKMATIDKLEGFMDPDELALYRRLTAEQLVDMPNPIDYNALKPQDFRTHAAKFVDGIKASPGVALDYARAIGIPGKGMVKDAAGKALFAGKSLLQSPNKWKIFVQTMGPKALAADVPFAAAYEFARSSYLETLAIQKGRYGDPIDKLKQQANFSKPLDMSYFLDEDYRGEETASSDIYNATINELSGMAQREAAETLRALSQENLPRSGQPALTPEAAESIYAAMMDLQTARIEAVEALPEDDIMGRRRVAQEMQLSVDLPSLRVNVLDRDKPKSERTTTPKKQQDAPKPLIGRKI